MNKTLKKIMIVAISLLAVIAVLTGVLMGVSGIFEKPFYLEPWNKSYYENFDDPRLRLSSHGLLAANGHNMQPWKIALDHNPAVFYLYADGSRLTDAADPYARQMMISQGTFLEYVRVAGIKLGYEVEFELFPMGQYNEDNLIKSMDEKPVAKITIAKRAAEETALYGAMFLPDTNRSAYLHQKLSGEQAEKLEAFSHADITLSVLQDEQNLAKLSDLALRASTVEAGVDIAAKETEEIFRLTNTKKTNTATGFRSRGRAQKVL